MAPRASLPPAIMPGRLAAPVAGRYFRACAFFLSLLTAPLSPTHADSVYRWVDADGVIHISSAKPPAGITAERINVGRSSSTAASRGAASLAGSTARSSAAAHPVSREQLAQREAVLGNLRTRECVYALESLDRLTSGVQPTSAAELRRLQQTVDSNCSADPVQRREQEAMAAKLRVANGSACLDARNRLAAMLEPGGRPSRDQLKVQQEFIETHCRAPVR